MENIEKELENKEIKLEKELENKEIKLEKELENKEIELEKIEIENGLEKIEIEDIELEKIELNLENKEIEKELEKIEKLKELEEIDKELKIIEVQREILKLEKIEDIKDKLILKQAIPSFRVEDGNYLLLKYTKANFRHLERTYVLLLKCNKDFIPVNFLPIVTYGYFIEKEINAIKNLKELKNSVFLCLGAIREKRGKGKHRLVTVLYKVPSINSIIRKCIEY